VGKIKQFTPLDVIATTDMAADWKVSHVGGGEKKSCTFVHAQVKQYTCQQKYNVKDSTMDELMFGNVRVIQFMWQYKSKFH
jgi:hypothetical protein